MTGPFRTFSLEALCEVEIRIDRLYYVFGGS